MRVRITGGSNVDAAAAELVIVTVPYDGHAELLSSLAHELAGKIVVDCVNPLGFDSKGPIPCRWPPAQRRRRRRNCCPSQR